MKETYPLHKNSKKGSFGFSFCFLKIFRFYRYQANMKKGAKIKMSEIQLRRKMNARTNASSKRDLNIKRMYLMKWKDIQKIVKNVHVFQQLRIDA